MRVSDYIAGHLEKIGVRSVFMLAGGGMMHLMDAIGRREKLGYVCNHHEHACALGAEGYARQSGELGVCYVTSGPGGTNTVTGVVECWQDSVPVLFVSGQSKLSQTIQGSKLTGLRQFGTFEVDIISIVRPVTKYAVFLDDPKMIRYHLEKAIALATSGRPGPVFLDIPVDLQGALVDPETLVGYDADEQTEAAEPTDAVIDDVIDRLAGAKRPLLLAGHGVRVSGERDHFAALTRRLNVPVVTTQLATDVLPYADTLFVGHPGMKGDRAGNLAIQNADVILSLGSSLHVLTTGYELDRFAPGAYKIQVEPDPWVLKREQVGVKLKIECSLQKFFARLEKRLAARADAAKPLVATGPWHAHCARLKDELAVQKEPHVRIDGLMNYYDIIDALSEHCAEGATLVTDAGSAFYVVGQAFRVKARQRVLVSGALGAMGHALPVALGACFAARDTKVVCLTGDGSFQTNIQELATVAHHAPDLAIFVVSNGGYLSIRNTQKNFFGDYLVGTDEKSGVTMPDIEKLAAAYGVAYLSARRPEDLASVVKKALTHRGPVICELFSAREQEIIPTVSSQKRDDGTMVSKPLHDMYPFLSADTLRKYLLD